MEFLEYKVNRVGYERNLIEKEVHRPHGSGDFDIIIFRSPVVIMTEGEYKRYESGSCIIYTPDAPQHYYSPLGDKSLHDWLHFLPLDKEKFLSYSLPLNVPFYPLDVRSLSDFIKKIDGEFFNRKSSSSLYMNLQLNSLILQIARESAQIHTDKTSYKAKLEYDFARFRIKLQNSLSRPWTVTEMANELGLSKSRFTVLYTSFFGISPLNDLIAMRVDCAKQILIRSDCSEAEVAERCGYSDIFHFIRQFKQKTGLTPSKYRTLK